MGDVTIPRDLVDLFEAGVSILVGTRDEALQPEATRAAGAKVSPDRRRITLFLPTAVSARALENIARHPEIAVGFSRAMDATSMQVKGSCIEVRPANDDERLAVERYKTAYMEQLFVLGLPRALTKRFAVWPAHAVTFEVRDIFLQTPGPEAGKRLEQR